MSNYTNYNNNNYNNNNFYGNQNLGFMPNEPKNKKGALFILSIIFFILGFLISCLNAFIYFTHNFSNNDTAYTIGYTSGFIICGIIFAVGLFLLATRVIKKDGVLLAFSIIYLLGTFTSLATNVQAFVKENQMNKAAEAKLVSICNNIAAGKDISGESYDESVYGDMAPLLNIIKDYGTKSKELSTNMTNNISSIDLANLLSPTTLSSTDKINNAKKTIEDSSKLFDQYETEYNTLISDFDTSISTTQLPKSYKSDFLAGFRQSQDDNHETTSSFFQVERDILSKSDEIMDFMLSAQGRYLVLDDQVYFETDADLNKYNGLIEDLQELAQKEADIQNTLAGNLQSSLDELN